jgi:hypothetical protein
MISKITSQKGSAHIIVTIILVVMLLGVLGFVFWQNFVNKSTNTQPAPSTETEENISKEVTYKTYQTDTHPISFQYPEAWSIENEKSDDQSGFFRSLSIVTDTGNEMSFSVGNQGVGGTCSENSTVTRSTIDVATTTLPSPQSTTLSYTITANADGSYDAIYGLTDTYTELGDKAACDTTFYYLFDSGNSTYMLMNFSGKKHFASLDTARQYITSDEYSAIKKTILTLNY